MAKKRVNVYIDAGVADRSRKALRAFGSNLSECVNDYLVGSLPMFEEAARSKDPDQALAKFHSTLPQLLAEEMLKVSEFMRTVQEVVDKQAASSK